MQQHRSIGRAGAANGLDQYLQQIIFSSDVGIAKPDPQIYRLALKKLNSSADETIFIDDRLVNIEGANAVGITGVLYQDFPGLQAELAELGLTNLPLAVR